MVFDWHCCCLTRDLCRCHSLMVSISEQFASVAPKCDWKMGNLCFLLTTKNF